MPLFILKDKNMECDTRKNINAETQREGRVSKRKTLNINSMYCNNCKEI